MVIFNTVSQALSAGDQQVMLNFYQSHNLPGQHIRTTQDVLNRSLALNTLQYACFSLNFRVYLFLTRSVEEGILKQSLGTRALGSYNGIDSNQ